MKKIIKKSIALILALVAVFSLAACNNAKQDEAENPTDIFVSTYIGTNSSGELTPVDAEKIDGTFIGENDAVIPVYTCDNIMINGSVVHVFAIDPSDSTFIGVDSMENGTAYFTEKQDDEVVFDISVVTAETEMGVESDKLDKFTVKTADAEKDSKLVETIKAKYFMPSMQDETLCFVTTDTYLDICSALLGKEITALDVAVTSSMAVNMAGICVYTDNIDTATQTLSEMNYIAK